MIHQVNAFTTYDFTDEEILEACKLSHLQRAFIQHQIGIAAQDKLGLKFDPKNPQDFIQNEAFLTGQIHAYQHLIASAEWTEEQIKNGALQEQLQARNASRNIFSTSGNANTDIFQPKE